MKSNIPEIREDYFRSFLTKISEYFEELGIGCNNSICVFSCPARYYVGTANSCHGIKKPTKLEISILNQIYKNLYCDFVFGECAIGK